MTNLYPAIIDKLKVAHEKFSDPDFGPTDGDEYGAKSLYGNAVPPSPAGNDTSRNF